MPFRFKRSHEKENKFYKERKGYWITKIEKTEMKEKKLEASRTFCISFLGYIEIVSVLYFQMLTWPDIALMKQRHQSL